jgi:hypothetical protein
MLQSQNGKGLLKAMATMRSFSLLWTCVGQEWAKLTSNSPLGSKHNSENPRRSERPRYWTSCAV